MVVEGNEGRTANSTSGDGEVERVWKKIGLERVKRGSETMMRGWTVGYIGEAQRGEREPAKSWVSSAHVEDWAYEWAEGRARKGSDDE